MKPTGAWAPKDLNPKIKLQQALVLEENTWSSS
jgi:hypothetical protein